VAVLHKQRIVRANDYAAALGIQEGMGTATARVLTESDTAGSILLLEQDTEAEQRALQQLCCWAYSITPTLYMDRADTLQLEIGGCLKLFSGLDTLLAEITRSISVRGYRVEVALAATPKAAWLLSFAEDGTALDFQQDLAERLAPLPLTLLDDFPGTVDSLHRAGLHTLGDILSLPSNALGRRCGEKFTHFLQQVLGKRQDLKLEYRPPKTYSDVYWFGYEVSVNEELFPAVQQLLQAFCQFLRNTQLQTSDITWQLIGTDSELSAITVHASTSHSDWENWHQLTCIHFDRLENWHQLTCIHFDRLELKNSVEGLFLNCDSLYAGELDSIDLFSPRNQRESLNGLLDRLRNRLGLQAIERIGCRDEHLPEFAVYLSSDGIGEKYSGKHVSSQRPFWLMPQSSQRPFWLMPQPQALKQHGKKLYWNGALSLVYGPERIEDNWWLEAVSRDYYIAENSDGQHYWVFRDRLARSWFIHGIFA
jgi:protein ImuB